MEAFSKEKTVGVGLRFTRAKSSEAGNQSCREDEEAGDASGEAHGLSGRSHERISHHLGRHSRLSSGNDEYKSDLITYYLFFILIILLLLFY